MPMVRMRGIMTFPTPKHTKKNLAVAISSSLTSAFLAGQLTFKKLASYRQLGELRDESSRSAGRAMGTGSIQSVA